MIVVVGNPVLRRPVLTSDAPGLAGPAALVAAAAARAGAEVQIVGRTGDDRDGDDLVLALATAGVGHVALLRVAGRPTSVAVEPVDDAADLDDDEEEAESGQQPARPEPTGLDTADVDLALRYLTDFRVLVVAPDVPGDATRVAARAAGWTGAMTIALVTEEEAPVAELPEGTVLLAAPIDDRDGVFANLVGEYAAALDRGEDAGDAFRGLVERLGWEAPSGPLEPSDGA